MAKTTIIFFILAGMVNNAHTLAQYEKDIIPTSQGDLTITFIGHGTLILTFQDKIIHIDPWSNLADYRHLPKADIILLTHEHTDHLDVKAIELIKKDDTVIVLTEDCLKKIKTGLLMKNGDTQVVKDIEIKAVPAYNIQHKRDNGEPFHPKGIGNGYLLKFGNVTIYIAGDTENIPEMADLKNIDVAFLPMNLPYTMTPEMVAETAKIIKPKILYPYHYGNTETKRIIELLREEKDIEVRIRKMS